MQKSVSVKQSECHSPRVLCPAQAKFMLCQLDAARVWGRRESTDAREKARFPEKGHSSMSSPLLLQRSDVCHSLDSLQFSAHLEKVTAPRSCAHVS